MIDWAWEICAPGLGIDPARRCKKSKRCGACVFCAWYLEEMSAAVDRTITSSKQLDRKRDFELVMAHFEGLAGGGPGDNPFYWNHRVHGGDLRRLQHNVRAEVEDCEFDEAEARAVACNALKRDVNDLSKLAYEQLAVVLAGMRSKKQRELRQRAPVTQTEEMPF